MFVLIQCSEADLARNVEEVLPDLVAEFWVETRERLEDLRLAEESLLVEGGGLEVKILEGSTKLLDLELGYSVGILCWRRLRGFRGCP
jgi:hypothetical protein